MGWCEMNYSSHDTNSNRNFIIHKKSDDSMNRDKKEYNKKLIIVSLVIVLIIILLGIILFSYNKFLNDEKNLRDIDIPENSYTPKFSSDIHDYYLLTTDKKITIKCDVNKNIKISGCNEEIDLSNYSSYIHQIVIDGREKEIYKIYIRVKESDNVQNISIDSIDGISSSWTKNDETITIKASSKNALKEYSIDNGYTFQKSNVFTIENNANLKIIVKDEYDNLSAVRQLDITNIDKTKPTGIIIKEAKKDKIILKAIAKDEESEIDSYSWNDQEYADRDTYEVTKAGKYSLKIRDRAGNVSEKIVIEIKNSDFNNKKQHAITFYHNGAETIGNDFLSCTDNSGNCKITLPEIERENAKIIGWSTDKNKTTADYSVGEKINLTEDITLYAITEREVKANFFENGADSISENSSKCTLYNDDRFCYVTTPAIVYSGGKIIGWNTYSGAESPLESPNSLLKVYDDSDYYALVFKEFVVTFDKNGADSISSTKEQCRLREGELTCFINTPEITRDGSEILGWSNNSDDQDAQILPGDQLEVENDLKLYAITRKNVEITFDKNGADSVSNERVLCSIYNLEKNCEIITPDIYRADAAIIGWNSKRDEKDSEVATNSSLTVNKNATYYAITHKKVIATFHENGASDISSSSAGCSFYNDAKGCTIKAPSIKRNSWKIIGWNTDKNATSSKVAPNSEFTINKSADYYAITSKTVTATFYRNNADNLGNCSKVTSSGCTASCNIYNLNSSCSVSIPYIYSKGNEVQFFSTSSNTNSRVGYSPANKLNLLDDISLYAIVDNRYRSHTFSIVKTKNYGYTAFETESGCPTNVYNNFYNFLDRVYKNVPYIFKASKVTFASENSFNETWGSYAGMTYGSAIGYRNIDIKCPNTYSTYYLQTIVHELTHGWDSYYKAIYGTTISDTNDFIYLYDKYSNATTKPFRSYSYTSRGEFVADVFSWYYFLYIDNSQQPDIVRSNPYFPKDIRLAIEKYINVSKGGYK